ncbi:C40 family peptidase [Anaeromyxobacter sp. PSR-1]|uniref:C40 family peptidase n=1 Tax=Anaeromyxobacter sp. PSR-1 TaxID=1300915 RepID=UPI0005DFFB26|nr:C40 family peptidase [Anaeromyxobacter sp. PSR-1]GAO01882.1 hypothetical protein PSR1_00744 [Anaeromyxobacter sp. PSR-1]
MSPLRTLPVALAGLLAACAGPMRAARDNPLPPPAQGRAGIREPDAGPARGVAPVRARAVPRPLPRALAVERAVATAARLVGAREIVVDGARFGDGCAALVRAAYDRAGAPLPPDADPRALHALARDRGVARRWAPAAGDLAFLADRPGGPVEHVGLVESAGKDGTAVVLHLTEHGVARIRVNLGKAWKLKGDDGRTVNDLLVVGGGRLPAGRLLVGYARLL